MTDAILQIIEESGHRVCTRCNATGSIMHADNTGLVVCGTCGGAGVRSLSPEGEVPKESLKEALDFVMPYGTNKGKSLREIQEKDPGYMNWLQTNITNGLVHQHLQLIKEWNTAQEKRGE